VLLILISFFDFGAGISGVIAVLIGQLTAFLFNFDKEFIRDGSYTFNSVLVGIAVGIFYDFNISFLIILVLISILTFFLTIWFSNNLSKKGLPFLSLPFLFSIWIFILGAENFSSLTLKQKEVLSLAYYFPEIFQTLTNYIGSLPFANAIYLYLRSLGAIFFQYNDLAGLVIVIGLLISSRISFVLSIFGFLIGYLFYHSLQGDFSQLIYSYIGFNFILTAIALGGFFVVASKRSFLLLLFSIPVISLLISGLQTLFNQFNLPLYSLPFNIVVLLFLSAMYARKNSKGLQLVVIQQYSLEKNHYKYVNSVDRFGLETYFHIGLPVIGEWTISQSYDGKETHKGDWKHALDFVVTDDNNNTYKYPGNELTDYYCYDLPIIAPANGYVVNVIDGIDDNEVGEVNLEQNWGNTIIIKHGEYLYSKLSHLKKNTLKVKINDYIKKGDIIAYCGSSGRSPEPHLHFQIQTTPFVGSKTIAFPISYYLSKNNKQYSFHSFEIPKKNEIVSPISINTLLKNAFHFIPGKTIDFEVDYKGKKEMVSWEVFVTPLNKTYFYCQKTGATAYFINNGTVFYFTDFYGNKNSLLHHFYLGAHKVLLGAYTDLEVEDKLMISSIFSPLTKFIHDFTAPFFHYCKANYISKFIDLDNEHSPSKIIIKSVCKGNLFGKQIIEKEYLITIANDTISEIKIIDQQKNSTATCIN